MQALDISVYIVKQFNKECQPITNLKLQKVLYYIQMGHLQEYGFPAFDDPIEAWRHGPVIYDIYSRFKRYTSMPISMDDVYIRQVNENLDKTCMSVCDKIIKKTLLLDPWKLVELTHQTEAWKKNYVSGFNNLIPLWDIQESVLNL